MIVVGIKGFWDNFKSTKINLKTNSTKTFMLPPNSPQLTQNSNNSSFAKINTNILVALGLAVGKKCKLWGKEGKVC